MLTAVAIIIAGIFFVVEHTKLPEPTVALSVGIILIAGPIIDYAWPHVAARRAPPA